jgi:hypothetical protein
MSANEAVLQPLSNTVIATTTVSKGQLWTGRILAIIAVLFMVMDGVMKLIRPESVLKASAPLGFTSDMLLGIGIVLLLCTALYVIPRTSVLGAALLTGYLGGAVAVMVRFGMPTFELTFPILFAVVLWISLWLRTPELRGVFPLLASKRVL